MEQDDRPEFDIDELKTSATEAVYAPSATLHGYGVGEMPDDARRFNWGAFLLMPIWGVAYGLPSVIAWWSVTYFLPAVVSSMLAGVTAVSWLAFATAAVLVVKSAVKLWVGMNANAWLWRRERVRLEAIKEMPPRFSVNSFFDRQRKWFVLGMCGVAVVFASSFAMATVSSADLLRAAQQAGSGSSGQVLREIAGMSASNRQIEFGINGGWLLAETMLGAWLAFKMRKSPAPENPARGGDRRF